jgi:hypothetical protein
MRMKAFTNLSQKLQELQRRPGALESSPGQLPLVEQIQQSVADMFRAELVG